MLTVRIKRAGDFNENYCTLKTAHERPGIFKGFELVPDNCILHEKVETKFSKIMQFVFRIVAQNSLPKNTSIGAPSRLK